MWVNKNQVNFGRCIQFLFINNAINAINAREIALFSQHFRPFLLKKIYKWRKHISKGIIIGINCI